MRQLAVFTGLLATLLSSAATAQTLEAQLVNRLNAIRAQGVTCPGSGRRPVAGTLSWTPALARSANTQAVYMAASGRITHTGQDGSTPRVRAASVGVNAVSVTEIIYMNSGLSADAAINWWLNSPVHCFYMTDARYNHVGASVIRGPRGTAYVMTLSSQPK
ncbi:CAP domain-containing protein [Deinococcus maricopensis]|uniref:SCP-like extracellular n=1 Tax=Deinococcus maricopensis (strain DSM 21211 / LMG 22137 / NRRL B-23946 / LB-34) TaxID=709986 RepID=E8U516_DEIML|nr:CAP domain-containing protein [Deinococcus maricopensis]ADV66155.1 SCP-like extracellular [Deinococcus maricopensis DSM 21211]